MTAEADIAAIDNGGVNTAAEVRTALTSLLTPANIRALAAVSSAHGDDDEFDDDTKTGITETTPTGTATWTEANGVLSVKFDTQSSTDIAVALKALTPNTAPVTIETAVRLLTAQTANPMVGVCFTDGTGATANVAATILGMTATDPFLSAAYGVINNLTAPASYSALFGVESLLYMRIVWTAANTFEIVLSPDGVSWTKFGVSDISKTMTPTHFGCVVSAWSQTFESVASFQYLRVTETDLSV